ncbi:MAG TPA: dihydrofolate reductase family protein [Chitinophagaceae bacterium]
MRKIITSTFMTLDGVIQAPGGPQEDTSGNFKYGGWTVNYWDPVMMQVMAEASQTPYDMLLGRKTYEIFAAHWPFVKNDPMADILNKAKKYVATNTLKSATWENTELLNGNVVEKVKKIKAEDGIDLLIYGSGNFIQTLLKNNLIDELRLWIFPLVIGNGKKLFAEGVVPANLKLENYKVSDSGVIMTTYIPSGEIKTGSFALDEPTDLEIKRRKEIAQQ